MKDSAKTELGHNVAMTTTPPGLCLGVDCLSLLGDGLVEREDTVMATSPQPPSPLSPSDYTLVTRWVKHQLKPLWMGIKTITVIIIHTGTPAVLSEFVCASN